MKQLTESVYWLRSAVGGRCYWLEADDRVAIIDPGLLPGLSRLTDELRRGGRSPNQVTDILLTHHDSDHAQTAATWQKRNGARVWLGIEDVAVLARAADPSSRIRRLSSRLVHVELPDRIQPIVGDTELWPGLTALHTPSHTPGHHCFRWRDVLFVGDAARAKNGRLVPSPAWQMSDLRRSPAELARLRALPVTWYCPGHSDPTRRR